MESNTQTFVIYNDEVPLTINLQDFCNLPVRKYKNIDIQYNEQLNKVQYYKTTNTGKKIILKQNTIDLGDENDTEKYEQNFENFIDNFNSIKPNSLNNIFKPQDLYFINVYRHASNE
jgi:hypothetical protein